ncbi:GNAT family N-acetyltransferase [Vibrio paucivorans]
MCELTIGILEPIKVPLVNRLYRTHYSSSKAKKDELVVAGRLGHELVTVVRFRSIEQCRLLTGMLVTPAHRSKAYGHQLMQYCREQILTTHDYCFAYSHLEGFYQQHGFKSISIEQLPNSLRMLMERYLKSGRCLIPMHFQPDN